MAKFDEMLAAWVDDTEDEEATEDTAAEDAEEAEVKEEAEENVEEKSNEESADDTSADDSKTETKAETESGEEDNKAKESPESRIHNAMQADIDEYNRLFPNDKIEKIDDIPDALAFAKMRRGGLSVEEAARYVRGAVKRDTSNGKEHIKATSAQKASSSGIEGMSSEEYAAARQIFGDMPKKELESLFKRTRSK